MVIYKINKQNNLKKIFLYNNLNNLIKKIIKKAFTFI